MCSKRDFFFTVAKLHRLATKEFGKRLSHIGMTHGLAAALLHLNFVGEGSSQSQVAESMEIEQPTLVNLIARLEEMEIVKKEIFPGDRRKSAIILTPKGRKLLVQIEGIYDSTYRKLFGHVEKSQLEKAEHLQNKMYEASKL
ncbi:MarR family winged helix-turn-helix transcriptional regulator [Marinobacter litoralis]|uniref:MarR family winged helix-turn-helix transcriptional regulator n=1 Tax=Marinobacter litoralis TaxID=187981 RepID=UPI0018ED17A0|nr:MarR family transcriptional regulator [Marinobacter litoralis]MBJ6136103.1 MarR family transcriptional regulator [Marinobacter litoralis]